MPTAMVPGKGLMGISIPGLKTAVAFFGSMSK